MSADCNVNGNIKSTVKFRGHKDSEFHLCCEFYDACNMQFIWVKC